MKQQIFVDNEYHFDYDVESDIHTLYYNNSEYWSSHIRDRIALQIHDDGNGLVMLTNFKEKKRIDYSEAEYLYILLKLINQPTNYEIGTKRPL
jgi:hypothetical protein